jgi:hypothetical protein
MSRVKTANDDKEEMKERKDEQKDAKEDTFGSVYERQMHLIKEMKDTYETHLSNAGLRFEKLDIAYKSLVKVNTTLKETLIQCEDERDAWKRRFMN